MFVLKGFIEHALFNSATPGKISTIGELSTLSMTYSRITNTYLSAISADMTLYTFTSANNATPAKLPLAISDHVMDISKYVYEHTIEVQTQVFATELLQNLLTVFVTSADTFECGEIVSDGDYSVPEWISWHTKLTDVDGSNVIKIWFSDVSFQAQYDDFEILVIPPMKPLDLFFNPSSMVKASLASVTPSEMMDRIQLAKEGSPETVVRAETYLYYDPFNKTNTIPTTWNFLIYGMAGNNIDAINDALVAYILANSTKTKDQWAQIIPEIFKHTEFIIIPKWNDYGIPNRTLEAGIYSPITNVSGISTIVNSINLEYPASHINANIDVVANPYKSLALLVIGSPDNRDAKFKIGDIFSDYIAVLSTSNDFSRMSQSTQDWATLLSNMLYIAESMYLHTSVPAGMSKVVRNGILYLACRFMNINYLVVAKSALPE